MDRIAQAKEALGSPSEAVHNYDKALGVEPLHRYAFDRAAALLREQRDYSRLERLGRVKFLSQLRVYESPRRYRHYGYLRVTGAWFSNFLCVYFLGRSLRREWKPIR